MEHIQSPRGRKNYLLASLFPFRETSLSFIDTSINPVRKDGFESSLFLVRIVILFY